MKPSFGRRGMGAFDPFSFKVHGQKIFLAHEREADPWRQEKKLASGDAGADVAKSLHQFLMGQNSAGADDVFLDLRSGWLHYGSIEFCLFCDILRFSGLR